MTTAEYFGVARTKGRRLGAEFDPGFSAVLITLVGEAWERFGEWRRLRRAVTELRRLDDRMLKDIGVSRSTVYAAARDAREAGGRGHGFR